MFEKRTFPFYIPGFQGLARGFPLFNARCGGCCGDCGNCCKCGGDGKKDGGGCGDCGGMCCSCDSGDKDSGSAATASASKPKSSHGYNNQSSSSHLANTPYFKDPRDFEMIVM